MTNPYQHRPAANSPCLCGSGLVFKVCCKGKLPGIRDIGKKWRDHAKANRWLRAIKALRADVTQYTIWHMSHTAPVVRMKPEFRHNHLMHVDIMALSEYVGLLMMAYAKYSYLHKAHAVLTRLATNIDDPRWAKKIAYHKGICALWQDDRDAAAKEIGVLGKITPSDEDIDILQIYLDLYGSEMGLTETLAFMDQIVDVTTSGADKLQYLGAKAFQLVLAKDNDGAREGFEQAIALAKQIEEEEGLSLAEENWLCRSLEGLAIITRDNALFDQIVTRVRGIVADPDALTDQGKSEMYRMIADAQRFSGNFKDALANYTAAYLFQKNEVLLTFKAECALLMSEKDEALSLIQSVDLEKLDSAERADHAFIFFYVAKAHNDVSLLKRARELLKAVKTPLPYFETQRLQNLDAAQDAIDAIIQEGGAVDKSLGRSWLGSLSRYTVMNPNFFGIGINLNNMIDDAIAPSDAKQNRLGKDDTSK
ncbi:SEC-C metal-binding domain-containing protein [Ruegeria denitrificans]|uniref:SEC-C metal-binding domain-containing protein n=1 Tax=Ruegeria denitrificans TaxID=1715692 RepID=UPI00147BC513